MWAETGTLNYAREFDDTATLLPNGKVLVAGGDGAGNAAELYDPAVGTWTITGTLITARYFQSATLLPNGKVLVAGGYSAVPLSATELYDAVVGFDTSWQPQITSFTSPISLGNSIALMGSQFRGVSEGSGGNGSQESSADCPVVQLRSLESGRTIFLASSNWSTNSFTSAKVSGFPPGWAMVTVFVNGIPSTGNIINVSVPVPTATTLTGTTVLTNGSFQFSFTNSVGALLGVKATTNLALPFTNWTALGGITEISPGQFQFTDPQATNASQRFYRLFTP